VGACSTCIGIVKYKHTPSSDESESTPLDRWENISLSLQSLRKFPPVGGLVKPFAKFKNDPML